MSKELDFKELQQLAAEILGIDANDVQLDKSFAKDLAADSLDLVELIAAVEDRYDVELSEERLETMKSIGQLWTFLEEEGSARGASAEHPEQGGRPPSEKDESKRKQEA
ncbi:MAG: acyl carrier protein [Candidatus Dormibacteraeota bacterium]|nr:acyl carrier protein [Candidatus Dormibacteraeota bacterium]